MERAGTRKSCAARISRGWLSLPRILSRRMRLMGGLPLKAAYGLIVL
jgi:hypothetical protein